MIISLEFLKSYSTKKTKIKRKKFKLEGFMYSTVNTVKINGLVYYTNFIFNFFGTKELKNNHIVAKKVLKIFTYSTKKSPCAFGNWVIIQSCLQQLWGTNHSLLVSLVLYYESFNLSSTISKSVHVHMHYAVQQKKRDNGTSCHWLSQPHPKQTIWWQY